MSDDSKTKLSDLRVYLKLTSGKIYGPYRRPDLIRFISEGQLTGQELILYEGHSQWLPLVTDSELFDLVQNKILGSAYKRSENAPVMSPTVVLNEPVKKDSATQTALGKTHFAAREIPNHQNQIKVEKTEVSAAHLPKPVQEVKDFSPPTSLKENQIKISQTSNSKTTSKLFSDRRRKERHVAIFFFATGLLFFAVFFVSSPRKENTISSKGLFDFGQLRYTLPLKAAFLKFSAELPVMPSTLVVREYISFPDAFHARAFIEDIVLLQSQASGLSIQERSFWVRLAWNYFWLAEIVRPWSESASSFLQTKADEIVLGLKEKKVYLDTYDDLFQIPRFFSQADWSALERAASRFRHPVISALSQEAKWVEYWAQGGKGVVVGDLFDQELDAFPRFQMSSYLRKFYLEKNPELSSVLQTLAHLDPYYSATWFALAQVWRWNPQAVERSHRGFLTLLGLSSLYPPALQAIYWAEFSEFQIRFGRKAFAEKAEKNARLVMKAARKSFSTSGKFWDLGSEGLSVDQMMESIFDKSRTGKLDSLDLSTFEILSPVLGSPGRYLVEAGRHAAFREDWAKALEFFQRAREVDPKLIDAWGGEIWANAQLYHFDRALEVYDEMSARFLNNYETLKYLALIHFLGREPEIALEKFQEYLVQSPADPWGQFFLAKTAESLEKIQLCLKHANLAKIQATGELSSQAELLYFRCAISGRVRVSEHLKGLEEWIQKEPGNISVKLTYVDALLHADLKSEALEVARKFVQNYSWSPELRLKLGEVYEARGEFDKALSFYTRVSGRGQRAETRSFIRIAGLLEKQGKFKEAAQNYVMAAVKDESYPEIFLLAARAFAQANDKDSAAAMYLREMEARPGSIGTFLEAADYLLKIQAPAEVLKLNKKFNDSFRDDPRVQIQLSRAFFALGDFRNARQLAANVVASNAQIPEAHRILGEIAEKEENRDSMQRHYRAYLELLPAAPDADLLRAKLDRLNR